MDEAVWDEGTKTPAIDWRMSAALENVPRGESDLAEVVNLESAVRDWQTLDEAHRDVALLTPERPLLIDGVSHRSFAGHGIQALADLLGT